MTKFFIVAIPLFLFVDQIFSQTKEYKLVDKTILAEINYNAINGLDTLSPGMALFDQVFKPTKGKFIVYRFLSTYIGLSFTGKQKTFHDVLVVKTDDNSMITDAYQYTLEWAEPPSEYDLYKSTCDSTYLTDPMPIDRYKFTRRWFSDKRDIVLNEKAIVKLN